MSQVVDAVIQAGKANAGPPLGPALGPSGVNVKEVIEEINKVRLPYNSNTLSQSFAGHLMNHFEPVQRQIASILDERDRIIEEMKNIDPITVFPTDSNFFIFKTNQSSDDLFYHLMHNGILVRNLNSNPKLKNCLRVTVGTKAENDKFISAVKDFSTT